MKTKYIIASLGWPLCSLSAQMPQYTSQRGTGAESATDGHHFRLADWQYANGYAPEIVAKAEKAGANSYRIIELKEGDNWHATAELYK